MAALPLVLLTRFSVRSTRFMEAAGIASERERERWFEQRARLFKAVTWPSLRAQRLRPDRWVLLFSAGDEALVERCLGTLDDWMQPLYLQPGLTVLGQIEAAVLDALAGRRSLLLSRMDNDDALAPDFFERIGGAAAEVEPGADELMLLARRGCRWDGAQIQQVDYPNNPFITLRARDWPARRTNPLQMNHVEVLRHPHRFVDTADGPSWLQVLHGGNASNAFKDVHGPLAPAEPAEVVARFHLLPSALEAIAAMKTPSPAAPPPPPAPPPAAGTPALDPKTARPRRLNALGRMVGARSYLEIGVATGATFFAVEAERKVAVDPRYRFDPSERNDPGCTYHTLTSNDYFTGPGFGESFDLMYLDGLHTFEQTLIDFMAAQQMAHARSVVLIDDTVPNDVFSAYPNQKIAFKYRAKTGNKSLVWHGDTYKLVVYIHDFMPMLSYMTFMSGGNPQTVVWREPRPGVEPVCGNVEKISRLDYFWLMENFDVLKAAPEPEVMARVSAWAGGAPK